MNHKSFLSLVMVVLNAPLAVVACSTSSGGGGGAGTITTIDSTKQASSLSDAEKEQYCKDVSAYISRQISEADSKKVSCFSAAMSAMYMGDVVPKDEAELRSKCKTAYQECMNKPLTKADAGATKDDCASAKEDLKDCTATVGELNTCFSDQATAVKATYAKFETACDNIQLDGGGVTNGSFEAPASCKAIEAKCPKVATVDK